MVLHYIIKKIISEYGNIIVSDLRLYNILMDINAFEYESESTSFVLKQVSLLRGKDILESKKQSLPATVTINQYVKFISNKCGFAENQVRYIIESIAYGIGWIKHLNSYELRPVGFEQRLNISAYIYNIMGINITQIQGSERLKETYDWYSEVYYRKEEFFNSFKNPVEGNWKDYITIHQDKNYISNLCWKGKTGLGIICGYNNIRAIDIDDLGCFEGCGYEFWSNPRERPNNKFDSFIEYCLYLLNLPKDYQWVVRSGSGHGIHIIFKCEDIDGLKLEIAAFPSKKIEDNLDFNLSGMYFDYKKNVEEDFKRLELYWKGHLVASPSIGDGYERFENNSPYEPNHNKYDFVNTNNRIPLEEPTTISIDDIDNLLSELCGKVTTKWHEYSETKKDYSKFYQIVKLENTKDSMGGYYHFKDELAWLENCNSSEGINSLGVYHVLEKQYDKARLCFKRANSDFAHYNIAEMILFGYVKGSKYDALEHYKLCADSKRIYKDDLDKMKQYISDFK